LLTVIIVSFLKPSYDQEAIKSYSIQLNSAVVSRNDQVKIRKSRTRTKLSKTMAVDDSDYHGKNNSKLSHTG